MSDSLSLYMKRLESTLSDRSLPPLEPMRQVGIDPAKPVWAIGHVTGTSPEDCLEAASKSRASFHNIAQVVWC